MIGRAGNANVAVVGGGIAGIAAAERLAGAGANVTILDARNRLGGVIHTIRRDGFVIEEGPDALLASKPAAEEFCARLGIADRLHGTTRRTPGAFVMRGGKLARLPAGMSGLVPGQLSPLFTSGVLSVRGIARAILEPFIPARRDGRDESVASFVTRRFGREVLDRLVEPLLAGIYAGNANELSVDATFPQLRRAELTHGSMVRAMRSAPARSVDPRGTFLSLPTGLFEIVEAAQHRLAELSVGIRLSTAVTHIATDAETYVLEVEQGRPVQADAIVIATAPNVCARLLRTVDASLATQLAGIKSASVAVVSMGFSLSAVGRELNGTGYVVPRVEQRPVLACTWSSAKWTNRSPSGTTLFRVFLGGAGRDALLNRSDPELVETALAEVAEVMGVRGAPLITVVSRWPDATPQYTLGYDTRLADIGASLSRFPRLALAGNAFGGVGISDCIQSGVRAAERIRLALGLGAEGLESSMAGNTLSMR